MIKSPLTEISIITDNVSLQPALLIRRKVFVEEQKVPEDEEYDQYEPYCRHFLATYHSTHCGTARWRFTTNGIKLERFAVLKEFRGKGIGHQIVTTVLADVRTHPDYKGQLIYLNAQIDAMPLYKKSGFRRVGEMFLECDIKHFRMEIN